MNDVQSLRNHLLDISQQFGDDKEVLNIALAALDDATVPELLCVSNDPVTASSDYHLKVNNARLTTISSQKIIKSNITTNHSMIPSIDTRERECNSEAINLLSEGVKQKKQLTQNRRFIAKVIMRCIIVDAPLSILFLFYMLTISLEHIFNTYLEPQIHLMQWNDDRRSKEMTYYSRICDENDMTTFESDDLIIGKNFSTNDCVHHMMTHGMSLYPDILTSDTATNLRDYILRRNKALTEDDEIYVINNENRWSFGIGVNDDPIVAKALNELSTHPKFRPALEKIAGINPAVIELTAITSAYGAEDQNWHADVVEDGCASLYAKSFVPSYSLFIALQDISTEMGATEVCPGTYMCSSNYNEFCEEYGFPISGSNGWKAGSGVLLNQQNFHRGSAHTDKNGSDRVLFILTFSPRPLERSESRQLGQGGSYSTRWDMWGHTFDDIRNAPTTMTYPWVVLRSLGLYKPKTSKWGWDFISVTSMRIANGDTGYTDEDLHEYVQNGGFGLPNFLSATLNHKSTWLSFLFETILILKKFAMNLNATVLITYFMVILLGNAMSFTVSKKRFCESTRNDLFFNRLFAAFIRLCISHGTISIIVLISLNQISCTGWAKDIKSKVLYSSAFTSYEVTPNKRPTTFVHSKDVLIGSHFDSPFLASSNQILQYHTGNKMLIRNLDRMKSLSHSHSNLQDYALDKVVGDIQSSGNRFLYQDSIGWTILAKNDAIDYTRRIFFDNGNFLQRALESEASILLSESRFGKSKSTIMSRKFTPMIINDLLFKVEIVPFNKCLQQEKQKYSIFHSSSNNLYQPQKSIILRHFTFPISTSVISSQVQEASVTPILKEGDIVEVNSEDSYEVCNLDYYCFFFCM